MFESQIIRILVYLIGFYMLFASIQQLITTNIFHYQSWVMNAVNDANLATGIVAIAVPIGIFIITSAYFNRRKMLLWALGFAVSYEIGAALLSAIDTFGQGTPAVPALFIGLIAGTLWGYYRLQPKGLCMEDTPNTGTQMVGYKNRKGWFK